jgi:hypothetical protein
LSLSSQKYGFGIRDPGTKIQDPRSGIRKKPIPDPGSRGQKDPGSGSTTLPLCQDSDKILEDRTSISVIFTIVDGVSLMCLVQYNDWLNEEVDNMAREGLRTLVVAKKTLSEENYADFEQRFSAAKLSVVNRSAQVFSVVNRSAQVF